MTDLEKKSDATAHGYLGQPLPQQRYLGDSLQPPCVPLQAYAKCRNPVENPPHPLHPLSCAKRLPRVAPFGTAPLTKTAATDWPPPRDRPLRLAPPLQKRPTLQRGTGTCTRGPNLHAACTQRAIAPPRRTTGRPTARAAARTRGGATRAASVHTLCRGWARIRRLAAAAAGNG